MAPPKMSEREQKAYNASLGPGGAATEAVERTVPEVFEPVDINRASRKAQATLKQPSA